MRRGEGNEVGLGVGDGGDDLRGAEVERRGRIRTAGWISNRPERKKGGERDG